ncbi:class I SAM-dependent methyltransferase [candidate division CSSED10-310 bacterium]|uniref:Class I SAM-dependent methyltransferase n=1 Tax=candidate division CSSED10-310 bacterium TaxID=2855610 RepID=A0ABV6YY12_UNCC1
MKRRLLYISIVFVVSIFVTAGYSLLVLGQVWWGQSLLSGILTVVAIAGYELLLRLRFQQPDREAPAESDSVAAPIPEGNFSTSEPPRLPDEVYARFEEAGVRVEMISIDLTAYRAFIERAEYEVRHPKYIEGFGAVFAEKSLEHFLSLQILAIEPQDVYLDVAAANSPLPAIVERLTGCRAYRQDLFYSAGMHGRTIGGDAGQLPLADAFADKIALHCSLEHFEGDADSHFIQEAARVLKPGGRLCIIPLYMSSRYFILTDPDTWAERRPHFDRDALIVKRQGWQNSFGRNYDVPHFLTRIRDYAVDLDLTIIRILDAHKVDPICYLRFVAVFDKPA